MTDIYGTRLVNGYLHDNAAAVAPFVVKCRYHGLLSSVKIEQRKFYVWMLEKKILIYEGEPYTPSERYPQSNGP